MTIFDKFQPLAAARRELEQSCDSFFNIVMQEIVSGTEAVVHGRPMILAGSNNYLGLSFDADCMDAACNAVRKEGTGTTGSRMANGTFSGHLALERELATAEIKKKEWGDGGKDQEPTVLPSRFPNMLVNGAGGIAVRGREHAGPERRHDCQRHANHHADRVRPALPEAARQSAG
mgnify:CR=1 FL=1